METITQTIGGLSEQRLKMLIKESVRESIGAEILKLRVALLPYVSDGEQKDIEKRYGKPNHKIAKSYDIDL